MIKIFLFFLHGVSAKKIMQKNLPSRLFSRRQEPKKTLLRNFAKKRSLVAKRKAFQRNKQNSVKSRTAFECDAKPLKIPLSFPLAIKIAKPFVFVAQRKKHGVVKGGKKGECKGGMQRGKRGVLRVLNIAFSFRLLRSYCTEFFVRPRSKKNERKKHSNQSKARNR